MDTLKTSVIYCGDNLDILSKLPEKSVDLIYADPPFFSNATYEKIWGDTQETRSFDDRWKGGIEVYIEWMELRLSQCHRVLKENGSMYLHCDWHANAHLKILMDKIFGVDNFLNEIIWCHYGGGQSKHFFPRKHDNIYFYRKGHQWLFNHDKIRVPYDSDYQGTTFTSEDSRAPGKSYKPNPNGKVPEDFWIMARPYGEEIVGYPTQKPKALLRRIIEASSNKGDIVLDPFCGCGTTIAVSQDMERKWIGIDISPTACRTIITRLNNPNIELIGMPSSNEELKAMKPFEFQDWVVNRIHGTHSNRKSGDGGVDGFSFMQRDPIQIKQKEHVGINTVKNFQPSIDALNKTKGYIIAFSFAKLAYEEVARVREKYDIQLVKIEELDSVFK
jgi:DNA modification methylase